MNDWKKDLEIDWQNVKIMLVDDENEVAKSVSEILINDGFNDNNLVFIQDNFENNVLKNIDNVDIVLMDLQLNQENSDKNGIDGLKIINEIKNTSFNNPIIILTNQTYINSIQKMKDKGFEFFVEKSKMDTDLAPVIELAVQKRNFWFFKSDIGDYPNFRYFKSHYTNLGKCFALFLISIENKEEYFKYLKVDSYNNKIFKKVADYCKNKINRLGMVHKIFIYGDKLLIAILFDECDSDTEKHKENLLNLKKDLKSSISHQCNFQYNDTNPVDMKISIKIQCNFCYNLDKDECLRGIFANDHNKSHCEENSDFSRQSTFAINYINSLDFCNTNFEFIPYFQPIRDKNDEIIKYEVLARVKKSNGEVDSIFPYLDAIKVTGTSYELTEQIIKKACDIFNQSHVFHDKKVGLSFNITNTEIADYERFSRDLERWIPWIRAARDKKEAKGRITFEILERDALSDHILDNIHRLDKEGYHIAIDDFGVECSSFDKVSDIARDLILKIDGKFIKDLRTNKRHQKIVRSIALAAQELNYLTVAEYVEDETTKEMLINFGIDLFQGYYKDGAPKPFLGPQQKNKSIFKIKK